jgi:hypothetical protein
MADTRCPQTTADRVISGALSVGVQASRCSSDMVCRPTVVLYSTGCSAVAESAITRGNDCRVRSMVQDGVNTVHTMHHTAPVV